jgi:RimJ/RimL family protein N-acetyltransferase
MSQGCGRLTGVVICETERLIIRPWTHSESDLDRVFDAYARWDVVRYLGSIPKPMESRDQAGPAVDRWAARATPDGRFGVWAAEVRETGVVAGTVLLVQLPGPTEQGEDVVEVGWHFHPDSWGHGYATEAAAALLAKGFHDGLRQIYAVVRPENEPSLAVCRRLGMTPLGRTSRWYDVELEAFRIDAPAPA